MAYNSPVRVRISFFSNATLSVMREMFAIRDVSSLSLEERVDLDGGLGSRGEGTLGTLTSSTETTEGMGLEEIS